MFVTPLEFEPLPFCAIFGGFVRNRVDVGNTLQVCVVKIEAHSFKVSTAGPIYSLTGGKMATRNEDTALYGCVFEKF